MNCDIATQSNISTRKQISYKTNKRQRKPWILLCARIKSEKISYGMIPTTYHSGKGKSQRDSKGFSYWHGIRVQRDE